MNYDDCMDAVQYTLDQMTEMDLIDPCVAEKEFQVIGPNSALDSVVLVTFLTGLEDRLESVSGKPVRLVLTKIHNFNVRDTVHQFDPAHPTLHVDTLIRYILSL